MNTNSIGSSKSVQSSVAKNVYTLIKVAIAILLAIGAFLATRFCGLNLIGQVTIPAVTFVVTLIALFCASCCQNEKKKGPLKDMAQPTVTNQDEVIEQQCRAKLAQLNEAINKINASIDPIVQNTPALKKLYDELGALEEEIGENTPNDSQQAELDRINSSIVKIVEADDVLCQLFVSRHDCETKIGQLQDALQKLGKVHPLPT